MEIILPFPPSLNTAYPTVIRNGKPVRIKSKKLKKWIQSAPSLKNMKVKGRCKVYYKLFFPDDRFRDGGNFLKAPLDYLVSQGVIKDDNHFIVIGETWESAGLDRENPRIEIFIEVIK